MKILNGNTLYEFTVAQIDSTVETNDVINVDFRYRKFHSPSTTVAETPEFEVNRSIQCSHHHNIVMLSSFVMDMLVELDVLEQTRVDMSMHFRFYLDRVVLRRRCNRGGSISVLVSLDASEVSPMRAAAIERRRERERENERGRMTVVETTMVNVPAKKAVVERLERERVVVVEEDKECAICLEMFGGEEKGKGIELPCLHVYHKECIIRWLDKNYFCPFCRFKLIDE